jgi:hypothetical protein
LFSKIQKWDLEHWFYVQKVFVKASEVDQELECEMHQNQIQGNDWVRHGLAPMTTTHIVPSCYEEW